MSRQEKSKQHSSTTITVRRVVLALFAALLITIAPLAEFTLARAESGMWQEDEVQIALNTSGFTPLEVARAAGAFAISVDNQNVTEEYILQLKAEDGTLLNEVRVQKGSTGWTVDLPAGVYTLTVADHPTWLCQITLQ
jgi:hypothetical protein